MIQYIQYGPLKKLNFKAKKFIGGGIKLIF